MTVSYISSTLIEKFVRKPAQQVLLFHTIVTLNEEQGHSNRYQPTKSDVCHLTEFEKNLAVKVQMQANNKVFAYLLLFVSLGFFFFNKLSSPDFSLLNTDWTRQDGKEIHQSNKSPQHTQLHFNSQRTLKDNWHRNLVFSHPLDNVSRSWSLRPVSKCRI